jgi:hypothetical protein
MKRHQASSREEDISNSTDSPSHKVDFVNDWGLGKNLDLFKKLIGVPVAIPGSRDELAARLAIFLKRRNVAHDWRVVVKNEQVECRWRGCPFVTTACSVAQENAVCAPCPISDVAIDFWRRSGWRAEEIRHGWQGSDWCGMTFTVTPTER